MEIKSDNTEEAIDARVVLFEKSYYFILNIIKQLNSKYFETEISYPSKDHVLIFQTSKKLSSSLVREDLNCTVVRAFLYNTKSKQMQQRESESHWRYYSGHYYVPESKRGNLITGLLIIPNTGKLKLIQSLIEITNNDERMVFSPYEKERLICDNMPIYRLGHKFHFYYTSHGGLDYMDHIWSICLAKGNVFEHELKMFNMRAKIWKEGNFSSTLIKSGIHEPDEYEPHNTMYT